METLYEQTPTIERTIRHSMSAESPVEGAGETSPLSPAAVLPEQFYARATGNSHPVSGVRALMGAMLEDALTCVQQQALKPSRRHHRLAREAEQWIFADNTTWVFSFLNVCAALGLEPAYLRARLDQWVQRWARPIRPQQQLVVPSPDGFRLAA